MDIFRELLVSILCSVVVSTVSHIVAYFLFLKKLPDKIHKEVESVLRQETERNTSFQTKESIQEKCYDLQEEAFALRQELNDLRSSQSTSETYPQQSYMNNPKTR